MRNLKKELRNERGNIKANRGKKNGKEKRAWIRKKKKRRKKERGREREREKNVNYSFLKCGRNGEQRCRIMERLKRWDIMVFSETRADWKGWNRKERLSKGYEWGVQWTKKTKKSKKNNRNKKKYDRERIKHGGRQRRDYDK